MKLNLIIDGNFFLHKLIWPLISANSLYGDLMNAMDINFKKHIEMYPFHQIWFVTDSKYSWRKEVFKEYKGNRIKDESVDWEFIFNTFEEFKEKLDPKRFTVVSADGVEGDDWIAHIVKKSNEHGISNLIMSTDGDLNQLLSWSINPYIINIQYRDTIGQEKVYFPNGYNIFINALQKQEIDLFELDWRADFINLIKTLKSKYTVMEIDPIESIFVKIVQGDKKDNVKSLYTTYTKTNKPRGIGEAGAKKIWAKFRDINPDIFDFDSHEFYENITQLVCEYKKADPYDNDVVSEITDNIRNNIRLLRLEKHYVPHKYYSIIEKEINDKFIK